MTFTLYSTLGLIGAGIYLFTYGALQLGFLRGSSITYTVLNMCAAILVLIGLTEAFNLSSAIVQVSWVVLSLVGLSRHALLYLRSRFNEEETALLAAHFPSLPPVAARQFLRLGQWIDVETGHELTKQGEKVGAIFYISIGQAKVFAHGTEVALLRKGDMVGEITVIHDGAATADVTMSSPGRIFVIPRNALLKEMTANHDFALLLGQALQIEAQRKIERANRSSADQAKPNTLPLLDAIEVHPTAVSKAK
jgi:CRP-like cAMP-binding protein